ncbi:NAD(P)/FAD-dependent oxidoreductase [Sodalis sp. RH21]|uniref:FAD/NAD(P)-dependent oxidoreductase n=1 Tax=unclassified Sodalis (in: enterobacteria) TaxID=2636512 RepID=UPI0039B62532
MNNATASSTPDVLIIGAGPAGIGAALCCREHGLSVTVLDEQESPGGRIYRRHATAPGGADSGQALIKAFLASGAGYLSGTRVWQVDDDLAVHASTGEGSRQFRPRRIIVATGALERPVPIPGWTLPGVMGAGAAQMLLKTERLVPVGPAVLAGCGPLLYLLAQQLLHAGADIAALVDTTPAGNYLRGAPYVFGALSQWPTLLRGMRIQWDIKRAGVAVYTGASGLSLLGDERVSHISFTRGAGRLTLPANLVLLHQGVVPDSQLTRALRAPHRWSGRQLCWQAQTDECGALRGHPGIYLAGDGAAIAGADAALLGGRLAALDIALRLDRIDPARQAGEVKEIKRRLRRWQRLRLFLDVLYRPARELRIPVHGDTTICRCEDVTLAAVRDYVNAGGRGINEFKSISRCGMGRCQGRFCHLTLTETLARESGSEPDAVGMMRARFPIKPLTLGQLADKP